MFQDRLTSRQASAGMRDWHTIYVCHCLSVPHTHLSAWYILVHDIVNAFSKYSSICRFTFVFAIFSNLLDIVSFAY